MDKALLVGINAYPGAPLAGCINDVMDMANYITKNCRFNPASVRLLTDARATTAAIRERLNWLVTGLKPGDRILFHYSGHGAQVPTRNKAGEVDGLDEVICPVDFNWSDTHLIRDKEFNTIFSKIPAGVAAWWISDSCHSGDLEREASGLGGRKPRRMIPPVDIQWRFQAVRANNITRAALPLPPIALIAGCQSNQTSADAVFRRRPNGALTYFLLQRLSQMDGLIQPMSKLIMDVRADLKKARYSQIPQLEGPQDRVSKAFMK